MSQENVEVVRRAFASFFAGDWESVEALVDPDIRWEETESLGPDASAYRGLAEARSAIESWTSMWQGYELHVEDYIDAGDEVVVLAREGGRGELSGVSADRALGYLATIREGKIVAVVLYGTWREALEAAGLPE